MQVMRWIFYSLTSRKLLTECLTIVFCINCYITESMAQYIRITNFLFNRWQQVMLDNCHSNPCRVSSGVPQGSVLGPLLFSGIY